MPVSNPSIDGPNGYGAALSAFKADLDTLNTAAGGLGTVTTPDLTTQTNVEATADLYASQQSVVTANNLAGITLEAPNGSFVETTNRFYNNNAALDAFLAIPRVNSMVELETLLVANDVWIDDVASVWGQIWPTLIDPDTGVAYANASAAENQIYNQGGIPESEIVAAIPSFSFLTNLAAAWSMDELGGNSRLDSTANGYHLTENNSVGSTTSAINNRAALWYNNQNNRLTRASNADLQFGGKNVTYSLWASFDDFNLRRTLVDKNSSTTSQREFLFHCNNSQQRMELTVYEDGGATAVTMLHPTVIEPLTLYHLAFGRSEDEGKIFISVNGVVEFFDCPTANVGTASLAFGSRSTTPLANPHDGVIDETYVWSGSYLRPNKISDLYNSGSGLFFSSF